MAEPRQIIQQRIWQITCGPQLAQAEIAVALGQWPAVAADDQRQMTVFRGRQIQCLQQKQLTGGIAEMIVAAQHMGYAHQRIIHRISEKKLWGSV